MMSDRMQLPPGTAALRENAWDSSAQSECLATSGHSIELSEPFSIIKERWDRNILQTTLVDRGVWESLTLGLKRGICTESGGGAEGERGKENEYLILGMGVHPKTLII